jgi:hypothetical protein
LAKEKFGEAGEEGDAIGKEKVVQPLADWIMATGVGPFGNDCHDYEAERVEKNDGWRREPFL